MKIYGDVRSGNCDKVRFIVDYLCLPYEWVEIDSVAGATRTPEFLAINSQGQVPVVQLADGRFLAQSNAIIRHIADGSPLLPGDNWSRAKMDEWMLDIMERYLRDHQWLVGESITLADVALLAYTRQAHLGGFDMLGRPKLRQWVSRCEAELGLAAV